MVKRIAVITVARSDYGIIRPVLDAMEKSDRLEPLLIVLGMHLAPEYGMTVAEILDDKRTVAASLPTQLAGSTPGGTARSMGLEVINLAQAYEILSPDMVMVLGDRFEMLAAAVAVQPFNLPIAHIHGGELSGGAIDDAMRHAITKLSHIHFVAHKEAADRVRQLGEEPERIVVSGAPALDALQNNFSVDPVELAGQVGLPIRHGKFDPLLVTFHPETRSLSSPQEQIRPLLEALKTSNKDIIFTAPNADPGGDAILKEIRLFCEATEFAVLKEHLGVKLYPSLMRHACAMVGNSSSGIIEAASFELPVVNIGLRQLGRLSGSNVLHVDNLASAISDAIQTAVHPSFRSRLIGSVNPYGVGKAGHIISHTLERLTFDADFRRKIFRDIPIPTSENYSSRRWGAK